MTVTEKRNFKQWNIAQGKANDKADDYFRELQEISGYYKMPRSCCAQSNLKQIILNPSIPETTKGRAFYCYDEYIKGSTRYDCLVEMLNILETK